MLPGYARSTSAGESRGTVQAWPTHRQPLFGTAARLSDENDRFDVRALGEFFSFELRAPAGPGAPALRPAARRELVPPASISAAGRGFWEQYDQAFDHHGHCSWHSARRAQRLAVRGQTD